MATWLTAIMCARSLLINLGNLSPKIFHKLLKWLQCSSHLNIAAILFTPYYVCEQPLFLILFLASLQSDF